MYLSLLVSLLAALVLTFGIVVVGVPLGRRMIEWYDRQWNPYGGSLREQRAYQGRHHKRA